jgi:hypothetical protein
MVDRPLAESYTDGHDPSAKIGFIRVIRQRLFNSRRWQNRGGEMSEWDDDDYLVGVLGKVAKYVEQSGAPGTAFVVARAAERLKELHDRLTAIEAANAERSAITERYYQQAVEETRDHGND